MQPDKLTNVSADDVKLDRLLHDWSEQTSDTGRLDDLRNRIVSSLTATDAGPSMNVVKQTTGPQSRRFAWMSGTVVASAAVLLLLMTCFPLRKSDMVATNPQLPPDDAWLRDDQLAHKAALLAAMEEAFDGHLHWLAETGDDVKLGLAASSLSVDAKRDHDVRMAVRVVVERRSPGVNAWQVVWAIDVLAREEAVVDTHDNDGELKLWAYQLPDGHIAIDSEITLTGSNPLHARSSGLQHDRQPIRIGNEDITDGHSGDVEYRVFQTVAVLDREVT
jgi:hypothetical protein